MRPVILSKRLRAAADMVTRGNRVCDVGCDHGFVPIFLIEQGISPKVLAMDVRKGPLSSAKEHIIEHGLTQKIETRLSDGLHNYNIGEADTMICAGMGGRLMMHILSDEKEKAASFREMILQPQSELEQFRRFLRESGYRIEEENMIEEDSKFYSMMRVVPATDQEAGAVPLPEEELCKLYDRYGAFLLRQKSEVLRMYLKREEAVYRQILARLKAQGLDEEKRKRRYGEVEALLRECQAAGRIIGTEGGKDYGNDQDQRRRKTV